jgi:hypothetical protein
MSFLLFHVVQLQVESTIYPYLAGDTGADTLLSYRLGKVKKYTLREVAP